MSTFHALHSGPACLIEGYRLLARPGLRRFVILPVLGNMLIILLANVVLLLTLDAALDRWLPQGADWLRWLLFPLVAFALVAGGLFAFVLLANLLLGPFLGTLAQRVRQHLGAAEAPPASGSRWQQIRRDLGQELRRLGYVVLCLLGVAVLGWIPLLQLLAAPLGILVGAWLLMVEYSGHSCAQQGMNLRDQLQLLRQHRLAVIGFGLASMGLLLVPLVNLLLLPAAVAGATVWLHERQQAAATPAA